MVTRNLLCFVTAILLATSVQAGEGWHHTYEEARDVAEQDGVPMLLHFHASYCGPCRRMSAQVFSQREVQQQLRRGLAAVEIDVQLRPDLAQQYGATTVPRDVIVFPGQPAETLNVGFMSTYAYMDLLRTTAARGARIAQAKKPGIVRPETKAVEQEAVKIVGLEGFCPVRLIRDREWVSGREDLAETHRGVIYHFSSSKDRDAFLLEPRKFTPQNLGCDPVVLYDDQQAINGKIKYGAFFDSKLFLFETDANRRMFKENPLKFNAIRHAVKVDELSRSRFN